MNELTRINGFASERMPVNVDGSPARQYQDVWNGASERLRDRMDAHQLQKALEILSGEHSSVGGESMTRHLVNLAGHFSRYARRDSPLMPEAKDVLIMRLGEGLVRNAYLNGRLNDLRSRQGSAIAFMANTSAKVEEKMFSQNVVGSDGSRFQEERRRFVSFVDAVRAFEERSFHAYQEGGANIYGETDRDAIVVLRKIFLKATERTREKSSSTSFLYLIKMHLMIEDALRGMDSEKRSNVKKQLIYNPGHLENMEAPVKSPGSEMMYQFGDFSKNGLDEPRGFHFPPSRIPFALVAGRFLEEKRRK